MNSALSWFQTSLPLAALPLCRVIIACCFRAAALSGNATLALSPSGIAPELNGIQLSAICRVGQSGKVIDLLALWLAWRCLQLGHPSAASGACAVVQTSSSKRQCGKLVWKQHYSHRGGENSLFLTCIATASISISIVHSLPFVFSFMILLTQLRTFWSTFLSVLQ